MQEMWVAPSSVCCWMVVVHWPPSTTTGAASTASTGGRWQAASSASALTLTAAAGHGAVDFTLTLPFLGIFALVPTLLAMDQGQLGLHHPLLLIQRQRHQRVALLANLAHQAIDLAPVQEQLPFAPGIVVAPVRKGVDADVHLVQPGLAPVDVGEGIDQCDLAGADRLDLRTGKHDPRLQRLVDVVLV